MGLQTFLKVLLRNWWLIALSVLITTVSTAYFAAQQRPVYRAETVVEVRPNDQLETPQLVISVNNSLDNRTTINTIARKAESSSMSERVAQKLGISPAAVRSAQLASLVVPQANLIEIRAESTNAQFAADVANTTAKELQTDATNSVLELVIIDAAVPPTSPIGRGMNYLIVMGLVSGLILGIIFALLEYVLRQLYIPSREPRAVAEQ